MSEAVPPADPDVWICLDLEATCDEGQPPLVRKDEAEIIEFAYAIYDRSIGQVVRSGRHLCEPRRTPVTPFCESLTGLSAQQLAGAGSLDAALTSLMADLSDSSLVGRPVCAVVHGSWDLELVLPKNCADNGLVIPAPLRRYVDLRQLVQRHWQAIGRAGRPPSRLRDIVEALGERWDGREHCGADDARMVATAFGRLLRENAALEIIDLEAELTSFCDDQDTSVCLDGLPFSATAPTIEAWFDGLGHPVTTLKMVLLQGRPSGGAVATFDSHAAALAALRAFVGGQLLIVEASGIGDSERLVGMRPLRERERDTTKLVSFPKDHVALDALRGRHVGASSKGAGKGKPGDWTCPQCSDLVFAKRSSCRRCGAQRPANSTVPGWATSTAKPGDWVCPSCGDLVFAFRASCRQCGSSKPS